jgi:hypothetical protein
VAAASMAPATGSTRGLTGSTCGLAGSTPRATRSAALEPPHVRMAAVMVEPVSLSGTTCCGGGVARPGGCATSGDGTRLLRVPSRLWRRGSSWSSARGGRLDFGWRLAASWWRWRRFVGAGASDVAVKPK